MTGKRKEAEAESEEYDSEPPPGRMNAERKIALFIDYENLAIGVREAKYKKFDIDLLLERLLEKGKIVVKRAYCDWDKFQELKRELHEAAIELIDIPARNYSGKNSADIRLVVDAMDMAWSKEHIDVFVIASGDSDFSPLVSKLKENDKFVIGVGVKSSSSDLLIANCDEFIFYEDLVRGVTNVPQVASEDKKQAECFKLLIDSIKALMRENKEILWGSMVKQTMQRKKPTFNEEYYGYDTFSQLLEDAQSKNLIKIKKDVKSGTYIITGFAQNPYAAHE
ncbi:MAG: NYN domain-containing protein [Thermoanaerobaculia bacterium]